MLQQTTEDVASKPSTKTVLQQVVEGDPYRNRVLEQIDGMAFISGMSHCLTETVLSKAIESGDALAPVSAFRQLRHENLQRDFMEVEKMARLRSGARGLDARKDLVVWEKKMEESTACVNLPHEEINEDVIAEETKAAVGMLEDLQAQMNNMQTADIEAKARHTLIGLGFHESKLDKPFSSLSGGWKTRCLLAATLVQTSDILILDEPTNFLDLLGILWLEHHLTSLKEDSPDTIVVAVSHDRDFVNAVASETIILRDESLTYFAGNISAYDKSIRHEILRLTRMKDAQEKQMAHMEKTITNNMRVGKKTGDENRIRQAKSRQKKLDDRMGLQVSAKGGRFKLNRDMPGYYADGARQAIDIPKLEHGVDIKFPEAPDLRFPGSLVSLEKINLKYRAAPKPTLEEVDLVIHMGDKIGILGLNGAGKSTLIRLLVDETRPSKGTRTSHPRLKIGYYSQHAVEALKNLGSSKTELSALGHIMACAAAEAGEDLNEQEARKLLGGLGLSGRTASDVPLAKLSGGQLVRVELARILLHKPHLLIMDEPTTHLDLPTVHALTLALAAYEGAVVLVSHDRFLIKCVVEGEPVEELSSGSEDEDEGEARGKGKEEDSGRRLVYELKGGRLVEKSGGVSGWETGLEGRLRKLGI